MTRYTLVNVATDRQMGDRAVRQLWIAAVSPPRAVMAVLAKVPIGWAAYGWLTFARHKKPEREPAPADAPLPQPQLA